ncbi:MULTISPECIES: DegT/DnrJ/EryC1/StrS family aminotransferase [Streptomyces]|uniref:DegT/DnrJ/EryC1/StrS family aminotransferase n=1 Tax=Streptomyces TaxID=1883 RepID=UPI00094000C9|nr:MULTISPECIES: DegT/DnrJ/EryC1/StrS family aminotransferase [unclassified Streptomyces]OKJ08568.1 glutamine--scyllo-inositol aminotransferase [Streptomyces sp. TSRI0261]QNQ33356.1 DegT/DnrJ/EryC1/StrS family aminotransferase [Streptomyces sp. CB00271]
MLVHRYGFPDQFDDIDALSRKISEVLLSGDCILGKPVERFEAAFAAYVEAEHAVGLNSGTDALVLALHALGVGPGDEVVTVANTFHSTVLAIARVGATPVLVDCTDGDFMMDLDRVEAAITPRTKALIAVHMFGEVLDMDRITALVRSRGLKLVEDCAQAVGARWKGRPVGTFGEIGCFSFHPSKNLAAAGDAGAAVTGSAELAERLRVLRGLGQRTQNHHVELGYSSRMDSVQALVLDHKLPRLNAWNRRRRALADRYTATLAKSPAVRVPAAGPDHVFHMYQLLVPDRDATLAALRASGIDAVVRYPVPIARQPAFAAYAIDADAYPNADLLARNALCLPLRPDMSDEDVDLVVSRVLSVTG